MQKEIGSISDFLKQGNFNFRIFDMGRRVTRISNQLFEKIENQQEQYPYPFQQSAWLAILFWDKNKQAESIIWFLKFPIDELGYLQLSSRDAFIQQLIDQLGSSLQEKQHNKPVSDSLKESPFAFKPKQDRLAIFHSKASKELGQSPSQYYAHTQEYLRGDIGYEQWKFLGLQGIADVVARLDEAANESILAKAIDSLPDTPLEIICNMLEHSEPKRNLSEALSHRLTTELEGKQSTLLIAALTRALSNGRPESLRLSLWKTLLESEVASEIEILAAISGRAWRDLDNRNLLKQFITALAGCNQEQFNILLIDLMAIPTLREPILAVMRQPDRTKELDEKIGRFFQLLKG